MIKKNFVQQLPSYFQTETNKKFYAATVDQLYQSKDSKAITSYIGRRDGRVYSPEIDYYKPEVSHSRYAYSLEPATYSIDYESLTKTDVCFYEDLLSYLNSAGGITNNHDRLFGTKTYSYAPPIDVDKFVNYYSYYWVDSPMAAVPFIGITDSEIETNMLGKANWSFAGQPAITSGMRVTFPTSSKYTGMYYIEGVGREISLVPDLYNLVSLNEFSYQEWDTTAWDTVPWDIAPTYASVDYITMERGCKDGNPWSRSNNWVHANAINASIQFHNLPWPSNAERALRPIIEFKKDIELHNYGSNFVGEVCYPVNATFNDIHNQTIAAAEAIIGGSLADGDTIVLLREMNSPIYTISFSAGNVVLDATVYREYLENGQYASSVYVPTASDVIVITKGPEVTASYNLTAGVWAPVAVQKSKANQAPLFNLYDINKVALSTYTGNNFDGNEIFSYELNLTEDAPVDDVLTLPIVFKDLGQTADILFENDLLTDRYQYLSSANVVSDITGYYFYKVGETFSNSWHFSNEYTKQFIVDEFVFGIDAASNVFPVSALPHNEITVEVNGSKVSSFVSSVVSSRNAITIPGITFKKNDFIKVRYYSLEALQDNARGYYEIPVALESNALNKEVFKYTLNEFTEHFNSVIFNQDNIEYAGIGQTTNYRDTAKDLSKGTKIVQTISSLPKLMQCSNNDMDVIAAIEYSKTEYSKFKNKFIYNAKQVVDNLDFISDAIPTEIILRKVLELINAPRQSNLEFSHTNMLAFGDVYTEEVVASAASNYTSQLAYNRDNNASHLYVWANDVDTVESQIVKDVTNLDTMSLLVYGKDYTCSYNLAGNLVLSFNAAVIGKQLTIRLYENMLPSYMPATPAKLGLLPTHVPRFELDESYATPTWVLVGHDGSRTVTFGTFDASGNPVNIDIIDALLFDLEKRIYNSVFYKFNSEEYQPLLTPADIIPVTNGLDTRYTKVEIDSIMFSQFNIWATKNKTNYTVNQTYDPLNWKTVNYTGHGSWKNVYLKLFRSYRFNTAPWEMFEFTSKPTWWDAEYGASVAGKYTSAFATMWNDIRQGIIRQGERAGQHPKYTYPSLSNLPVDALGNVMPINSYLGLAYNSNPDAQWDFGDMSPVENAWVASSDYQFALVRLMLLTRPAMFSSVFWDNQDRNTYYFDSEYGDYSNIQYTSLANSEFRDSNNVTVHGELVDSRYIVKFGYQHWCTDFMLKSSKSIENLFGYKIRSLNLALASRLGGYTNASTLRAYLESASTTSSDSLRIPDSNLDVLLHKGKPVRTFVYSGVIVRITEDSKYAVYGYDNAKFSFTYYDVDSTRSSLKVTEGGKPAAYVDFELNAYYEAGQIVKYNTLFYSANVSHLANGFTQSNWSLLPRLPVTGGVTVNSYKSNTNKVVTIPYGHEFNTVQDVYTFLVSYGEYLESMGWALQDVDTSVGALKNWEYTAREFLYWVSSDNPVNSAVFLNPVADKITLDANRGYADNVERVSNGFYSILDKTGIAIDPKSTVITRDGKTISVQPATEGGIYLLRVSTSETEHVLVFDNITSFGDVVYDPVLSIRQTRLKLACTLTQGWYGKFEAPGYLIVGNELVQNYENLVSSVKDYYNTESLIDNQDIEAAARSLIGYQDRSYLNNLGITDEVQFGFYQGFVKEKGTLNSVDKLLRSTLVEDENSQTIVTEDWAFKVAEYGNIGNQELTVKVLPKNNISKRQVVSIEYTKPKTLTLASAQLVKSGVLYNSTPEIIVNPQLTDLNIANIVPAVLRANIVNRKLVSVDVLFAGSGYTLTPNVYIADSTDIISVTMQYEVEQDNNSDYEYVANLFDTSRVVSVKPYEGNFQSLPLLKVNDIQLPVAGYGNLSDVDYAVYNTEQLLAIKDDLRNKSVYIANLYNLDWNVYTIDTDPAINLVAVGENATLTNVSFNCKATFASAPKETIVFAIVDGVYTRYVCKNDGTHNRLYNGLDAKTPVLFDTVDGAVFYVFKSLRQAVNAPMSTTFPMKWVDNINAAYATVSQVNGIGGIVGVSVSHAGKYTTAPNVKVTSLTGTGGVLSTALSPDGEVSVNITLPGTGYVVGDVLVFSKVSSTWAVIKNGSIFRKEEVLIDNTSLNESYLYSTRTNRTLSRMPVFDPVKGLVPGIIDRNVDYKTSNDPAVYDSTINASDTFGENEVGKVWWDLNSSKFMWYEQPRATNESIEDIVAYRRQYWGKVFPGAPVDVYEWTESWSHPSSYVNNGGDGTPKNETEYVVKDVYNPRTLEIETKYYFWVKGKYTKPTFANRVMSVSEVANMIRNIQSSGYESYACLYKAQGKDIYALFNVDNIISNDVCAWNFAYGLKNNKHTEWKLLSEADEYTGIPTNIWTKFVDSICGYTAVTESTYPGAINIGGSYVLPVPDRRLNAEQRYGIDFRPRQTMFVDLAQARREFAYKVNLLLKSQLTLGTYPSEFLAQIDWFAAGFSELNTKANTQVQNSAQLATITSKLFIGAIVYVTSTGQSLRYDGVDFTLVRYKNGTLQITDKFYNDDVALYNAEYRALIEFLMDKINFTSVFFTMVRYILSEQSIVDWCFKTSYINVKQTNKELAQAPFFTPTYEDNLKDYIKEAKPYHTKIRNYTNSLASSIEVLPYEAEDKVEFKVKMELKQVCNNFGWEVLGWDTGEWDPSDEPCQYGVVLDGGTFDSGWDISAWDISSWDIASVEYDLVIDSASFDTTVFDYEYTTGFFNSPGDNGAPRDVYVNGVAETILIKVSVLNIPDDININTYSINRALIGQEVTTNTQTVTIRETTDIIVLTGSPS